MSRLDSPDAVITSTTNARVKHLVALRRRRERNRAQVTLVEGFAELQLVVEAGGWPTTTYVCPDLFGHPDEATLLDSTGGEVVLLSRPAFEKAAYRQSPDGWLAEVPSPVIPLAQIHLSDPALVLVVEGIEKPGNLGAMVRTAEAVGADAVIACDPVCDWDNPNVVRASKGTVFSVPVSHATLDDTVAWLGERNVATVVATPEARGLVSELDLTGPLALVVGTEHDGVTPGMKQAADHLAKLPMRGRVNSLNVATSAAVALYEVLRQRG